MPDVEITTQFCDFVAFMVSNLVIVYGDQFGAGKVVLHDFHKIVGLYATENFLFIQERRRSVRFIYRLERTPGKLIGTPELVYTSSMVSSFFMIPLPNDRLLCAASKDLIRIFSANFDTMFVTSGNDGDGTWTIMFSSHGPALTTRNKILLKAFEKNCNVVATSHYETFAHIEQNIENDSNMPEIYTQAITNVDALTELYDAGVYD
jgi:hypothetical protein